MWLFTKHGFFSATRSRTDASKIQVRARAKKDIQALRKVLIDGDLIPKARKVLETPGADYRWRLILTPQEWAIAMALLGEEIDYPNFKDAIHDIPEQADKLDILHRLWSMMYEYQAQQVRLG